jgi:hypothetical protein
MKNIRTKAISSIILAAKKKKYQQSLMAPYLLQLSAAISRA